MSIAGIDEKTKTKLCEFEWDFVCFAHLVVAVVIACAAEVRTLLATGQVCSLKCQVDCALDTKALSSSGGNSSNREPLSDGPQR